MFFAHSGGSIVSAVEYRPCLRNSVKGLLNGFRIFDIGGVVLWANQTEVVVEYATRVFSPAL